MARAAPVVMSSPLPRLSQKARHAQILALLRRDGVVRIATLAQTFDVTTETARRDLDALAATGA
jgi:DeoR/GlpR family transcriptional regulator of sugar metabolism